MQEKLRQRLGWLFFWLLAIAIATWLNHQNRHLTITNYQLASQNWPTSLDGWRLVQLSDLHNQAIGGPGNQKLLVEINKLKPDIIVITGDTFDARITNINKNLALIRRLQLVAPVYLTLGNHEFYNDDYVKLTKLVAATGATVLRDQAIIIGTGQEQLTLVGLDDPTVLGGSLPITVTRKIISQKINHLKSACQSTTTPIIVLTHRPELWPEYLALNPLVILSGHTHGGQIRLPLIGAIYVPNQELWPTYDQGHFTVDSSQLIISRGLGNSSLNQRLGAYPELVSLTINKR